MNHPLGQLLPSDAPVSRDATHVATIALVAAPDTYLGPGDPFGVNAAGLAVGANVTDAIGVTDPFLKLSVRPGERFWGCLYPNTVINLSHTWEHHKLPLSDVDVKVVEVQVEKPMSLEIERVIQFGKRHGLSIDDILEEANMNLNAECRGCN